MTTYVTQRGDYAALIAKRYTGDERRWPELCAANPQLKRDPKAGCVIYADRTINIPPAWSPPPAAVAPSVQRPDAELVYVPPQGPTVVDMGPSVPSTSSPSAPAATKGTLAPWIKWSLFGGSVLAASGVMAWLILRKKEEEPRPNGIVEWVKQKLGREAPKPNRRRKRGK